MNGVKEQSTTSSRAQSIRTWRRWLPRFTFGAFLWCLGPLAVCVVECEISGKGDGEFGADGRHGDGGAEVVVPFNACEGEGGPTMAEFGRARVVDPGNRGVMPRLRSKEVPAQD